MMASVAVKEAAPYSGVVETGLFELERYETVAGKTIRNIALGYETAGTLNARRDNAVLIPPPNTGSCHFAGRRSPDDREPGYWDEIVGSGRALDTDRFFFISLTTLSSYDIYDGFAVTTGPSSINPDTGERYGTTFPQVQIRDFVTLQKMLLNRLGITRLHAVIGGSMGGQQAFEWAAIHPEMVGRIMAVVPMAWMDPYTMLKFRAWRRAVMQDPAWNRGHYHPDRQPVEGLLNAFRLFYTDNLAPEFFESRFGRKWASPDQNPVVDLGHRFAASQWFEKKVEERARLADANNFIYMQRAMELFSVGGKHTLEDCAAMIKTPTLLIASKNDKLFSIDYAKRTYDLLRRHNSQVEYFVLQGPMGHFNGFLDITPAGRIISRFLTEEEPAREPDRNILLEIP